METKIRSDYFYLLDLLFGDTATQRDQNWLIEVIAGNFKISCYRVARTISAYQSKYYN